MATILRTSFVAAWVLGLGAALAQAAVPAKAAPRASFRVTLRYRWTANTEQRYLLEARSGSSLGMALAVVRVDSVAPDGTADLSVRLANVRIAMSPAAPGHGGLAASMLANLGSQLTGGVVRVRYDARGGRVADLGATGVVPAAVPMLESGVRMLDLLIPRLPERPVGAAETWSVPFHLGLTLLPGMAVAVQGTHRYTLGPIEAAPSQWVTVRSRYTIREAPGSTAQMHGAGQATGRIRLALRGGGAEVVESIWSPSMRVEARTRAASPARSGVDSRTVSALVTLRAQP